PHWWSRAMLWAHRIETVRNRGRRPGRRRARRIGVPSSRSGPVMSVLASREGVALRYRRLPRWSARVTVTGLLAMTLAVGWFAATGDATASTTTCEKFAVVPVAGGAYNVQTNEWNSDSTQCVSTDGTAGFSVTQSAISVGTSGPPGSYPSIYRGCHWGACTSNSGLPIQVSNLGHPTSSWSTTQTDQGAYDVAYDIWFNQ